MDNFNNEDLKNQLLEFLNQRNFAAVRKLLDDMNEVDIAELLEKLPAEKSIVAFRTLPKEVAAEVFSNLESDTQQYLVESITDQELHEILEDLSVDDAVDMVEELPANMVKRVLKVASKDTRTLINKFLQYPENSAGSIMTAEFMDLRRNMTVKDSIRKIRRTGEDSETIYTCYVIDDQRILQGIVTVKDLLLSNDDCPIEELMDEDIIKATTTDDREDVANNFSKYDLLSMPVVDKENRLVGIITVDDAMDVMEQEATEDMQVMGAMAPEETPYLKTGVFRLAKNRIVWLLILMVSGMINGSILNNYEAAFSAMPILVSFIPMLTDTGGNAGSQSSTIIIRSMALGEVQMHDFWKVLWKEIRVSIMVGVILSVINFVRLIIIYPDQPLIALTISLAMICTVIMAKSIGGVLPMIAKALHLDPALMAAPLITTIVDAVSLIIYFSIAAQLLHV
ncbi:MAG: magnesium transporter [Clostridiales bacterium]|jgi:magnesium transporter|nr:magnesium transporter [Clostridiales bacterium]MCI2160426.1 magnesium transporter [Oscillospiraceae bacterium]MCI1961541.1 magnesium transporter [Clostridiales bacterium]MCI2022050.1 magnesium transporter [Clostridiales bacterium]MCI2025935.1 magnesium transporter [Clostridiales bacterium]